ncbi:hypothetical protein ACP70R_009408 [Stipagrostis hirtigluma subsp. patula]
MASRSKQPAPLCLTDLPDEVVLEILSRVDINDAARTSAVSRAWRHRWRHLGSLVFSSGSDGRVDPVSIAQSVLLRHLGEVRKFALVSRYPAPPPPATDDPRLDDLLGHLSHPRHGLLALVLSVPYYKMHSSILSCVKLVKLFIEGCLLPNPTPGFAGLPNLLMLHVRYTSMLKPHLNSGQLDTLGALISRCPRLMKLELIVGVVVPGLGLMLRISAPRLRDVVIEAWSSDLMVEFNSPLPVLASAKLRLPLFRYAQEGGFKLLHVLRSISRVEKLELLDGSGSANFADMMPFKIPVTFEKLQYLSTDADLGRAMHIVFLLRIIRSCPNIREIEIKCPVSRRGFQHNFEANQEFWDMHGYGDLFRHLRVMKLIDVYLSCNELDFINLVLSKAQVLEKLSIVHRPRPKSSSLDACVKIMKFKRASPLAQIDYKDSSTK